ncbi:MAG: ABC transporter substrate-binding protein [Bullifex sp.]|nr:ABC transporter substrate-binding protein [Spirochaetales bacterium]MDY5776661.1 ABC transporter substrate-binding protein [Bullifex sp.]
MKKKFVLALILITAASLFAMGTREDADYSVLNPVKVRVAALKGPTAMGMVNLMEDGGEGSVNGNSYEFTVVGAPTEITPMLVKGEVDIAALPANLAAVIYNNTKGKVKVLAVNTLGVLYICENGNSVSSIEDLKGKTIYSSGKGSSPEYALAYILEQNGLSDLPIEWKSEHAECVAALLNDPDAVALLPQPFATTAIMKNPSIRIALDLNKEWDKVSPESALLTGVVVARTEFVEKEGAAVERFLEEYGKSTAWVNENVAESSLMIGNLGIVTAQVAEKALPYCNIVCITGSEMKERLSGYLEVLYNANAKSVGGVLPGEDFYY